MIRKVVYISLLLTLPIITYSQTTHDTGLTTLTNPNTGARTLEIRKDNQDPFLTFHDPGDNWFSMGIYKSQNIFNLSQGGNLLGSADFVMNTLGQIGLGTAILSEILNINGNIKMTGVNRRIFLGGQGGSTFGIAYDAAYPDYGIFYTEGTPDYVSISPNGNSTNGVLNVFGNGNVGIGAMEPGSLSNSNQGSWPSYSSSDKVVSINSSNIPIFELASSSTSNSSIGSIYFTNINGQSDAHRQIAGILPEKDTDYTAHPTLQGGKLIFITKVSGSGNINKMVFDNAGKLAIGTANPSEKLEVNGTIRSKKVKVEASGWPDYVFAENYQLPTLTEIENFIKTNGHLPEVPSAKEVEGNGLDLGDMEATLLKKTEEITLYMIEMKQEIETLKKENNELKEKVGNQ